MKKYFIIILLLLLLFYSKSQLLSYSGHAGTPSDPIQIANVGDLNQLSSTPSDWGKYFKQTADINCYSATLTVIGNNSRSFTGNYNGQNFSISYFYMYSAGSSSYTGLFGYAVNATLTNINVNHAIIAAIHYNNINGVIFGVMEHGTISNCSVSSSTLSSQNPYYNTTSLGGIGGYSLHSSTITNCSATNITITSQSGGGLIAGSQNSNISNCHTTNISLLNCFNNGGFISNSSNDNFNNCYTYGVNSNASFGDSQGAFAGSANSSSFTQCYTDHAIINGNESVGGFCGGIYNDNTYFNNCYAINFSITASVLVGGFIGASYRTASFTNCYTTGTINVSYNYCGGFFGFVQNAYFTNCYSNCNINFAYEDYFGGFGGNSLSSIYILCNSLGTLTNTSSNLNYPIGGFIGYSENDNISKCYSQIAITINVSSWVGGFIGYSENSQISNCYSQTSIYQNPAYNGNSEYIGGFVGVSDNSSYAFCYAAGALPSASVLSVANGNIGGFISNISGSPTFTCCYWDTDLSGYGYGSYGSSPTNVTGYTTAQMKSLSTYTSSCLWDFSSIWKVPNATNYPRLQGFPEEIITTPALTDWARYSIILSLLICSGFVIYRKYMV